MCCVKKLEYIIKFETFLVMLKSVKCSKHIKKSKSSCIKRDKKYQMKYTYYHFDINTLKELQKYICCFPTV